MEHVKEQPVWSSSLHSDDCPCKGKKRTFMNLYTANVLEGEIKVYLLNGSFVRATLNNKSVSREYLDSKYILP